MGKAGMVLCLFRKAHVLPQEGTGLEKKEPRGFTKVKIQLNSVYWEVQQDHKPTQLDAPFLQGHLH